MKINGKYVLFGGLYFSQFIPLGFFTEALPVYLKSLGYPLQTIGMVHMLLLPWMVKFLWAPFVDKIGSKNAGHYRYWILIMQVLVFLCLIYSAFTDVSINLTFIFISIGLLSLFSSTQDIATDAYAVEILKKEEQGFGNSIQNSAHFLGSMIGGGLILVLLTKTNWMLSNISLGIIVLIPCFILLFYWNKFPVERSPEEKKFSFDFFKRTGNIKWIIMLALLPMGNAMADFVFKPYLFDAGYSLEEIGVMRGIIGLSAGFIGAITGGFFIKNSNRKNLLFNMGLLLSFSLLLFIIPVLTSINIWQISIIIILNRFISGFFITVLFTLIMERCEKGKGGTDFSIQIAVLTFSSHGLSSSIAGFLVAGIGYAYFFFTAFIISLLGLILYRKYAFTTENDEVKTLSS